MGGHPLWCWIEGSMFGDCMNMYAMHLTLEGVESIYKCRVYRELDGAPAAQQRALAAPAVALLRCCGRGGAAASLNSLSSAQGAA